MQGQSEDRQHGGKPLNRQCLHCRVRPAEPCSSVCWLSGRKVGGGVESGGGGGGRRGVSNRGAVRVSTVTGMSGMTNQFGSGLSSHPPLPLRSALLCSALRASHRNFKLPHSRTSCLTPSLSRSLSLSFYLRLSCRAVPRDLAVSWSSGKCDWGGGIAELPVFGPQAP